MKTYARDAVVIVRPFTRQSEGEEIVIGNVEMNSYLSVPPEAVELLDYLTEGKSIGEVKDLYLSKYGEDVDLDDFLSLMQSRNFIADPDIADPTSSLSSRPPRIQGERYHFGSFPQTLAAAIYSPPVGVICLGLIVLAAIAMLADRTLIPRPTDFIFPDHRAFTFLVFALIALSTVFLHELSHVIAARALGINARLAIGHRLWFVVAEADITGLWTVPKRQRYLPFLAGMLTDSVSAALIVLFLAARDLHWIAPSVFTIRIARALVFSYWLRLLWQFYVFVRTDVYFVIANFFECKNLLGDTEIFLRNLASQAIRSITFVDQSGISEHEIRVIRAYSALWILGRLLAFYVLFSVTLPVAYGYFLGLSRAFERGYSADPYNFTDSILFSAVFLIPLGLGFFLWIRGLFRHERA